MPNNLSGNNIKSILQTAQNIAIVGLSDSPLKPSFGVANYMRSTGYHIIPVNPNYNTLLGEKCYQTLSDIKENIDIVNIFRRPEYIPAVVEEAIDLGATTIWMQLGIINEEAAQLARNAGLNVIMDKCIKIEHRLHLL